MERFTVREYLRVSRDVLHTGRSPDEQHAENARAILQRGWELHPSPPYRDTDRSASRYAKRPREDFKRLIDDLETGAFGADVLAIWESSRGSRRVGEWVDLVDLCRARGVRIWVTTHDRLYDPAVARDRRSMLEDAVDAEYESDKTSERRRRSAQASADAGRPHGKNVYGYVRIYDERTRALLRVEPHPEQAPIVQEAARRVIQGDSYYTIARDFNARGVPPRRVKRVPPYEIAAWSPSAVKEMLRLPAYAGKRSYRGEIVGDGIWDALVTFEDWQRIQAILDVPRRKGTRDHSARYLLTGIARCGICMGPLKRGQQTLGARKYGPDGDAESRGTYISYRCAGVPGRPSQPGHRAWHVAMKAEHLDEIVIEMLFARSEQPDFLFSLSTQSEETRTERDRLQEEIASHEAYIESIRQLAAAAGRFDLILDQEARLKPLVDAKRLRLAALSVMDPYVQELILEGGLRAQWDTLTLANRRRVIRSVMTPVVHRTSPERAGRREPNHARVEPLWR